MLKGLHGILINIQGDNVGTVETPFIGYYVLYTVQSQKIKCIQRLCVFVYWYCLHYEEQMSPQV